MAQQCRESILQIVVDRMLQPTSGLVDVSLEGRHPIEQDLSKSMTALDPTSMQEPCLGQSSSSIRDQFNEATPIEALEHLGHRLR